jgi:hypothetical protein
MLPPQPHLSPWALWTLFFLQLPLDSRTAYFLVCSDPNSDVQPAAPGTDFPGAGATLKLCMLPTEAKAVLLKAVMRG